MTNNRYLVAQEGKVIEQFYADSDEEAENYVEENYTPEAGSQTLYRLTPICTWP